MTTVVMNSEGERSLITTGAIPERPELLADNTAQAAKREAEREEAIAPKAHEIAAFERLQKAAKPAESAKIASPPAADSGAVDSSAAVAPEAQGESADDIEDEDGLTPRQKREFTASMLKTIGKKTRQMREAEESAASEYRRAQLIESENQRLQRELDRIKGAVPEKPAEVKAPDRKDFETDALYADALIDYRVEQKLASKAAEERKASEERRQAEIVQTAHTRVDAARAIVPDYDEVVGAVDMPVPAHIAGYMQRSALFAELGYHFAKHPEVLESLAKLPPDEALVEIGVIKSTLKPFAPAAKVNGQEPSKPNGAQPSTETGSAPSKPRIQAPVIRPLVAGSAAQVETDLSKLNTAQSITHYERTHGVKLTARKRH